MHRGFFLYLFVFAAALFAIFAAPGAVNASHLSADTVAPSCHAASGSDRSIEDMVNALVDDASDGDIGKGEGFSWRCDNQNWRADYDVSWLYFDASDWKGQEPPKFYFSRIARFEAMEFATLGRDGAIRTARFLEGQGHAFAAGPVFQLPLPEISEDTTALIVRIEGAHSVPFLTESKLTSVNEAADWSDLEVAFLALVVGMLVLPLFLNITFFVALRERYVLLHAAVALAMIGYVVFAGGLTSLLVQLPIGLIAVAGPLCWAMGSGFLALFLAEFLEEGAQSAPMRKLTLATGWFSLSVTGFFALQLDATQGFDGWGYYFSCIPVTALITAAIGRAAWKGSVSARYIAAGWLPIVLSGIERMMRGLGIYVGPSNLDQLLYLAWGIQVIMLSLAIAHRFVMIRSERDAALREARVLERLSERDPLTGLLNRRVVEERIAKLRKEGFDTFALIDLDRFKLINDQYGHQTGDEVLVACGKALGQSDEHDCVAARLGGEEFVVLLRGKDAYARAEALRRSIPELIANEVEGVKWPVTASMGLIELPRSSHELLSFQDLYSRADQLLYNAKASGRNRTCFERLKVFNEAPQKRQPSKVAA